MKKNQVKLICPSCDNPFYVKWSIKQKRTYCSLLCRNEGYRNKSGRICKYCDKFFIKRDKRVEHCSKECAFASRRKFPPIECKFCNKVFKPVNSTTKYCSSNCYHKDSRSLSDKKCLNCNKTFRPYSNKDIAKYCSKNCALKHKGETYLEEIMRIKLEEANISYKPQQPLLTYTVDFLIENLVVECDGDFWHKSNKYDNRKDRILQNNGFTVFRFSEIEIENDIENCVNEINDFLGFALN